MIDDRMLDERLALIEWLGEVDRRSEITTIPLMAAIFVATMREREQRGVEHRRHYAEVRPILNHNPFLDHCLKMRRAPDGVEMMPEHGMCSGDDGYIHFSIIATIGEEAAWQAVGDDHAVPANVSVNLMRPANISAGCLTGTGVLLRAGKNVIVSEGTVMQDMKLIAKVTATFVHFEKRPR